MKASTQQNIKTLGITVFVLIVLNILGSLFFHRFDLTKDKQYYGYKPEILQAIAWFPVVIA